MSFLMAIEEINNDSTFLPGYNLNYIIGSGLDFTDAASEALRMSSYDVDAAIVAVGNDAADSATRIFNKREAVVVNSMATDSKFGQGDIYKYRAQTIPIDSFSGVVCQSALCSLNLTRVAVFVSNDYNGIKFRSELFDEKYCTIEQLIVIEVDSWHTEFHADVEKVIDTGATVIVISLSSASQTARLLETADLLGMSREDTQMFVFHTDVWEYIDTSAYDVATVLKGAMALKYWPGYSLLNDTVGISFVERWSNQTSTMSSCSSITDSIGSTFLLISNTYTREWLNRIVMVKVIVR
jgi:ABC-type branched-subunit amino acid transport system substrate-binding protein